MKKPFVLCLIFLHITPISAKSIEIGCDITSNKEKSCEEENIFTTENIFKLDNLDMPHKKPPIEDKSIKLKPKKKKEIIKITENLSSITVLHRKKSLTILRATTKKNQSCPPSCIQPINIKSVKTVGTLETLNFIDSLNKNKRMILVDSRATSYYKKNTIPTATNIPNSILKKKSKHSDIILKLLGAKKIDKKWTFKHIHTLLIFDNGSLDTQASKIILRLIELGYPQNKILYYHGGIKNWIDAGLTTI